MDKAKPKALEKRKRMSGREFSLKYSKELEEALGTPRTLPDVVSPTPGYEFSMQFHRQIQDAAMKDHPLLRLLSKAEGENCPEAFASLLQLIPLRLGIPIPKTEKNDRKGDVTLLQTKAGTFFDTADFPTAEQYLGITPRRRQQLISEDVLKVVNKGRHRRIEMQSLLAYLAQTKQAK